MCGVRVCVLMGYVVQAPGTRQLRLLDSPAKHSNKKKTGPGWWVNALLAALLACPLLTRTDGRHRGHPLGEIPDLRPYPQPVLFISAGFQSPLISTCGTMNRALQGRACVPGK